MKNYLKAVLGGFFLGLVSASGFAATEIATSNMAPSDYAPVSSRSELTASLNRIRSLSAHGKLNESRILRENVHGAAALEESSEDTSGGTTSTEETPTETPVESPADDASFKIESVQNWVGELNGRPLYSWQGNQYLVLYGRFPSGNNLTMLCGRNNIPIHPTASYISETQINLQIPKNLLDRQCTIQETGSDASGFDFTLNGLTYEQDTTLYPGLYRDGILTKGSKGERIVVNIQDGRGFERP